MRRHVRQGPRRRADAGDTKSANGRRVVGLPAELVKLLGAHRQEQDRERQLAAQLWQEGGWVFTSPTGQPVNPNTEYHEWKRLLRAAGVREARLHDARHTAATVLLVLGVPERAVMSLMGWADTGMAKRYHQVTGQIREDIALRLDGLLWRSAEPER
jgi:integrase